MLNQQHSPATIEFEGILGSKMGDFARLNKKLDQIERDLQAAATNVTRGDPRDCDSMDIDAMLAEKKVLEGQMDVMQSELERLDVDNRSDRSRATRTSSPGELQRPRAAARSRPCKPRRCAPTAPPTPPAPRRWSSERSTSCRCRCNTFLADNSGPMMGGEDRVLRQVQQDLEEATGQKLTLQERISEMEEQQTVTVNEQEDIQSMLEEERERTDQMNEENMTLKEQIQRLELELSNLPLGDCGMMREASVQISQLLQTLNEDMAKAPELCSRLRMAAQQIIDVEKRCANERGARSMDQQEVQFLRNENQRLREVAFRANMSAFQATVQVPPQMMMQQQLYPGQGPMMGQMPYGGGMGPGMGMGGQQMEGPPPGGRRKSLYQRMFRKKEEMEPGPVSLQFQDGNSVIFDPALTMQQQRLSMALQESPDEAAKRVQMLNQDKMRRGCCGK